MKKLVIMIVTLFATSVLIAQGNSGKIKSKEKNKIEKSDDEKKDKVNKEYEDKVKDKEKKDKAKNKEDKDKFKDKQKKDKVKNKTDKDKDQKDYDDHDKKIWDGAGDDCMKPSKNQPAKVRAAFQRDYPNATNVRWTKCRGDWTASFNGNMGRSTAVYHANGERKDTRTPIVRESLPERVRDGIFKRNPRANVDEVIRIEAPKTGKEIFRVKYMQDGLPQYEYYDSEGERINYNY